MEKKWSIEERLRAIYGTSAQLQVLSGGDIANVYHLKSRDSDAVIKAGVGERFNNMCVMEMAGLKEIANTQSIAVPEVLAIEKHDDLTYLLLEYIPTKSPNRDDMERLGYDLAHLHQCTAAQFGWGQNNYIGTLGQINDRCDSWSHFYAEQRLLVQYQCAISNQLLHIHIVPKITLLKRRIQEIVGELRPSLLHGDLWSGNYLIRDNGIPYLIDPAVYYGDARVDIAMTRLFGGFGAAFYNEYHNNTEMLCNDELIDLYQLYYLLVHLNLFGQAYHDSVVRLTTRLFG